MIIPIRTDRPPKRTPVVTQGLIVVNMLVYLLGGSGAFFNFFENPEVLASFGQFDPRDFKVWQLVTYQFLHDPHGIWHLAFNMLFLWVFGAAVEDRLGRLGFLGIAEVVERTLESIDAVPLGGLDDVWRIDREVRRFAAKMFN